MKATYLIRNEDTGEAKVFNNLAKGLTWSYKHFLISPTHVDQTYVYSSGQIEKKTYSLKAYNKATGK